MLVSTRFFFLNILLTLHKVIYYNITNSSKHMTVTYLLNLIKKVDIRITILEIKEKNLGILKKYKFNVCGASICKV